MKYVFSPDKTVVIISALCIAGLVFALVRFTDFSKWYTALPISLVVLLFIYFALKTPRCVYVEKDCVTVKQVWGAIRITDIKSIKPLPKRELNSAIRLFGNGGFLGYTGIFRSPRLGKFYMAAVNTKQLAVIVTNDGKTYVINYPTALLKNKTEEQPEHHG